ncbi:MAG: polysaccharide biosynthesis/export family protein [Muribaculaceae bacterium]|nr:polysaccharide biosynthesis/export family protein [Muribaculaceae bacterium]
MNIKTFLGKSIKLSSLFLASILVFASCGTPKKVAYFQDVNTEEIVIPSTGGIIIRPNDKLSITVKTMEPSLSALFNLPVVTERFVDNMATNSTASGNMRNNTATSSALSKYTVSPQGTIDFPVLGEIKVTGMNRFELAGFIKGELMGRNLAKDPVVTVEFINMGVSILGEIKNPGFYDINQDHISIIEAISMAGDLNLTGKRDNVAVLRETPEGVKTYRVDLTNFNELSQSPAYYLQQGDIVYIEPNDMRKRESTTNGNNVYSTGFWISVASLLTSVTTTIGVFVLR